MNLNKLFEIQSGLDFHIVKEKGLEGQDLLDKKILALQVELGELANEWRGFKFWKVNPQPRTSKEKDCFECDGKGVVSDNGEPGYWYECYACSGDGVYVSNENPLLEEYVDCLHFILSIGLEIKCTPVAVDLISKEVEKNITKQFIGLFDIVSAVRHNAVYFEQGKIEKEGLFKSFHKTISIFLGLGEMLGFTTEQIEQAYLDKNKINHERQVNGY